MTLQKPKFSKFFLSTTIKTGKISKQKEMKEWNSDKNKIGSLMRQKHCINIFKFWLFCWTDLFLKLFQSELSSRSIPEFSIKYLHNHQFPHFQPQNFKHDTKQSYIFKFSFFPFLQPKINVVKIKMNFPCCPDCS